MEQQERRIMRLSARMTVSDMMALGKILCESGFFSDARTAAQCVTKIIAGQELGIGPFAAMTGIYIVKGRVTLSANLMASRIKASGKYDYRIRTSDATECLIEFLQKNGDGWTSIGTSRFTMQDAVAAQVANGDNWKKYPRNMLFARAMSNGFKWFTPDLASGAPVFTPEEMGVREGVNPETGEVIEGESTTVEVPVPEPQAEPGTESKPEPEREQAPRRTAPLSLNQKNKLVQLYVERFGGREDEAVQGLDAVFESSFKHPMGDATLAEASMIISKMIAQKNGGSKATATTPASTVITNPEQLLTAIEKDQELGDYYAKPERGASIYHLQGAIRLQLASPKWAWPRPNDADGWKDAYNAAVMYAKDQIAQKQAA